VRGSAPRTALWPRSGSGHEGAVAAAEVLQLTAVAGIQDLGVRRAAVEHDLDADVRRDLVGGQEAVALVRAADDRTLYTATGKNTEAYTRTIFDASEYVDTAVYLKVTDDSTGGWEHVNLDDLHVPVSTLTTNLTGSWRPVGGTWSDVAAGRTGSAPGDAWDLNSQTAGRGFTYEGDVTIGAGGGAGALVFCANSNATQFYAANIDSIQQRVTLWGPGISQGTTVSASITPGATYHLRVAVNGSSIQVYLNTMNGGTTPVLTVSDSTYVGGQFGINVWNGSATLQNLQVS
jgi:hypothetical protein